VNSTNGSIVQTLNPGYNAGIGGLAYEQQWAVSTSSSPSNGGSTTGAGTYDDGTTATVTATTNSGYTFANWTVGGSLVSTSASYPFTASADSALVANFTQITYTIAVSASPSIGGTVGGSGTFAAGTSQAVTAEANSGYVFADWTESGSVVNSSTNYNFTLNGNRNLVANFTAITPPKFGGSSVSSGKILTTLTGLLSGETIVLQVSSDLKIWTPIQTNVVSSPTLVITNSFNPGTQSQYFRVAAH
jgi:Divergent InlB B-repeat domain